MSKAVITGLRSQIFTHRSQSVHGEVRWGWRSHYQRDEKDSFWKTIIIAAAATAAIEDFNRTIIISQFYVGVDHRDVWSWAKG